jgi:NADPH2 dehydrogenase
MQLWALGRAAREEILANEDPSFRVASASAIPLPGREANPPTEMSASDIKECIATYAQAASIAVHRAGFDGVEVHGAHGYLVDQFLQEAANQRNDEYGGTLEKRSRFGLEVVDAISQAVGPERTAIRISPYRDINGMGVKDPVAIFGHFITELRRRQPNLAYLHVVDFRADDAKAFAVEDVPSLDFARELWKGKPFVSAGGYSPDSARLLAEKYDNEIVAFGRHFISNPDLPLRIRDSIPLTPYDRSTFYSAESPKGYIDYLSASEQTAVPLMAKA